MTVAVALPSIAYLGNGISLNFAVPYRFRRAADLQVVLIAADGSEDVQLLDSDYSVSGGETDAGGTVTMQIAPPNGTRLLIERFTPRAQEAQYETNDTFPAKTHEGALDRGALIDQEQDESIGRTISFPRGEAGYRLPPAPARRGRVVNFASTDGQLLLSDPAIFAKGDPGGNILSVGPAVFMAGLALPAGANTLLTSGYYADGDGGAAEYVRVTAEPAVFGSGFRTVDRFLPDGSVDPVDGGWWQIVARAGQCNVLAFGAKGDGVHDDTPAIRAALQFMYQVESGGTVNLPWTVRHDLGGYYRLENCLPLWPRVSLIGTGGVPKLKNLRAGETGLNFMRSKVLLPGNLHPVFTQALPEYDCGTVGVGNVVTLADPADAAHFAVGEQVLTKSDATALTGGFDIPLYMHLNVIKSIAGAVVTLEYPIDIAYAGHLCRLADVTTGTERADDFPLFFSEKSRVENIDIEAFSAWLGDTGTKYVDFNNLTVKSIAGFYGNAFQDSWANNCRFEWAWVASELSLCSLRSGTAGCTFQAYSRSGLAPTEGLAFNEASRDCHHRNFILTLGASAVPQVAAGITYRLAQDCSAEGTVEISRAGVIGNVVYVGDQNLAAFPSRGNRCAIKVRSAGHARSLQVNGMNVAGGSFDFTGDVSGTVSSGEAVRIENTAGGVRVRQATFASGTLFLMTSASKTEVTDCYIHDGLQSGIVGTDAPMRNHTLRRLRTRWSAEREDARFANAAAIAVANGAALDVYSADLGRSWGSRDTYSFEGVFLAGGNNSDRVLSVRAHNVTTGVDIPLFTHTIPGANNGYYAIRGKIMVSITALFYQFDITGAAPASYQGTAARPTGDEMGLRLGFDCTAVGNGNVTLQRLNVDHFNPYWSS